MLPAELAIAVVPVVSPHLPLLISIGSRAAESAASVVGKKVGEVGWERARSLWSVLWPKIESNPAARAAAVDVASMPDDSDAQSALRLQLRKLFTDDQKLAEEVAEIWEKTKPAGYLAMARGERSVAIGGNATGNLIVTGDNNSLGSNRERG